MTPWTAQTPAQAPQPHKRPSRWAAATARHAAADPRQSLRPALTLIPSRHALTCQCDTKQSQGWQLGVTPQHNARAPRKRLRLPDSGAGSLSSRCAPSTLVETTARVSPWLRIAGEARRLASSRCIPSLRAALHKPPLACSARTACAASPVRWCCTPRPSQRRHARACWRPAHNQAYQLTA